MITKRKEEEGRSKEEGGRRKKEGGRRKEQVLGGMRKEAGGRRQDTFSQVGSVSVPCHSQTVQIYT